jgi:hypothetical protein
MSNEGDDSVAVACTTTQTFVIKASSIGEESACCGQRNRKFLARKLCAPDDKKAGADQL